MFDRLIDRIFDRVEQAVDNVGDRIINKIDNVEIILTDVETEGKKQGYARAAREYEKVFASLQTEWANAAQMIEASRESQTAEDRELIARLQMAESRKERLKQQLDEKARQLSKKQGIPIASVQAAIAGTGSLFALPVMPQIDILDMAAQKKRENAESGTRGIFGSKGLI